MITYDTQLAHQLLRAGAGDPRAGFRPQQEEAIRFLVEGRAPNRLLLVQKTGWGKSFVYFIATKLLRRQGKGPVLLISPLLALMRNQIAMAERLGVAAAAIHSGNKLEWKSVVERLARNEIDILLIAPERLANQEFREDVYAPYLGQPGMWVVDEAHCISDWGHDFRPDYRRIESLVHGLPSNVPLLATTATANDRVVDDLEQILGPDLRIMRGDLDRPSLRLQTIVMPSPRDRLAWLAENVPQLPGSGIIYTLTVRDAKQVARWMRSCGVDVCAYTGSTDSAERPGLENDLLDNRLKALAATSALGMGFDKPDLGFVIHYQAPGSVIAYYQQVGRAGRGIGEARGVLLSGREDKDIIDYFREHAFPTRAEVKEVLAALRNAKDGLSFYDLETRVNLNRYRLRQTLKLLELETPAPLARQGWLYQLTPHRLGAGFWERVERLNRLRREEQDEMREYVGLSSGHMNFLIKALNGSPVAGEDPPALPPLPTTISAKHRVAAEDFQKRDWFSIAPRKKWPRGGLPQLGVRGPIPEDRKYQRGRALSLWGFGALGRLVKQAKYQDARFPDQLVEDCRRMFIDWNPQPAPRWVACVPSHSHPDLVPDFARRLADALGLPFRSVLEKTGKNRPAQKGMNNSRMRADNADGAFRVNARLVGPEYGEPVLLVDDVVNSRWTMTVCAWLLLAQGSGEVFPLALAQADDE